MKFALVQGRKSEAFLGGRGICRGCASEVIGKCGELRIHHWAHKVRDNCPAATKEETPWHRMWKDKYPLEWQEWHGKDPATGERHYADVKTEKGLVLEFQNSPIKPAERRSREAYYKNMLWVVNGARLKLDYPRFRDQLRRIHPVADERWHYIIWPNKAFPKMWQDSSVLVFFDFLGETPAEAADGDRLPLWCLFPGRIRGHGLVVKVLREEFQRITIEREFPFKRPTSDVQSEKVAGFGEIYSKWLDHLARPALGRR